MLQLQCMHASKWWTLLISSLHKLNSCWYYHMRSFPSEVCRCMLPRTGCICTACGHLKRYAAQDMQKGANCYASHNIATMSKAGPTDLTAILLAALIAKMFQDRICKGTPQECDSDLISTLQGGKCCLMSKKPALGWNSMKLSE